MFRVGSLEFRFAPRNVFSGSIRQSGAWRFSNRTPLRMIRLLMKFSTTVAVLTLGSLAFAQENPPPEKLELIPAQPGGTAPAAPSPLPLIPEPPPTEKTKPGAGRKPKKSATEAASDELQKRIRFREVKTRAFNDPAVRAEWDRAQVARTDYEKREALKSYYKLLFGRMRRIDGSLKNQVAASEERMLRRLRQTRIDPTEPIDPQERADRFRE